MSEQEKIKSKTLPLTGAHAVAEAMRQINPEVVAAYPITPQTPIIEEYARFVADGLVQTEMVTVESEHSALSATVGASAAGVRAMTATSSQGLALMWEVLGVASGLRLPIVMPTVNRALSAPINIHCDHSDSMGARDMGWLQIFSETAQEAYENTLLAVRLAEHPDVLLPAMVMQDGFITSHCVENAEIYPDAAVRKFLGEYRPRYSLLNTEKPVTIGPLELQNYYFETKYQQMEAMAKAKSAYLSVGEELSEITGRRYPYFEEYELQDAEVAIVVLSSAAGTAKVVVDELRKQGKKVGLLKPILFRPFPYEEMAQALSGIRAIAVLDRSVSFGASAPLCGEIKNSLFGLPKRPKLQSYVFGLGGREIWEKDIEKIYNDLLKGNVNEAEEKYVGLRK